MDIRGRSDGDLMEIRWRSGGDPVEIRWRSDGDPVEIVPAGFCLRSGEFSGLEENVGKRDF